MLIKHLLKMNEVGWHISISTWYTAELEMLTVK